MPPIRLREGLAFSRDVPRAKHQGHPLEGQDWQCIFHAFPLGAGQIIHALPLGAGRHGFSCPLDAGRHGFSCTSPCFQFIMEDWHCPDNFKKNGLCNIVAVLIVCRMDEEHFYFSGVSSFSGFTWGLKQRKKINSITKEDKINKKNNGSLTITYKIKV